MVLVGLAGQTLPPLMLAVAVLRNIRIKGNYVGSKKNVEAVYGLLSDGKVRDVSDGKIIR